MTLLFIQTLIGPGGGPLYPGRRSEAAKTHRVEHSLVAGCNGTGQRDFGDAAVAARQAAGFGPANGRRANSSPVAGLRLGSSSNVSELNIPPHVHSGLRRMLAVGVWRTRPIWFRLRCKKRRKFKI